MPAFVHALVPKAVLVLAVATLLLALLLSQYMMLPADAQSKGGSYGESGSGQSESGDKVIVKPAKPPPPPPCTVSVGAYTSGLTYVGLPRNNPDGTYYPGDAFTILLTIGSSNCSSVSTSISGDSGLSIACPSCSRSRIDISPFAAPGTYTVMTSVFGTGPGGSGAASTSLSIRVADPMIVIRVLPANVIDRDGYLMRNADGTYYINDAVALKYDVDYRFKNERMGLIEPEVTRIHPYSHIADLDCFQESCTLVVPQTAATSEYRAQYAYASGIAVANATADQGHGQKDFRFDVRLKNTGVYTGMKKSYTHTVSIVEYRPVFESPYPYVILKDDAGADTYGRKLAVGVHYLGSAGQNGAIEPLRRAKVNFYANNVTALVLGTNNTMDIAKDANLRWLYTEQYGGAKPATVYSTAQGKSVVVIERAGYVKFLSKMQGYSPNTEEPWIRVDNVTALQRFYSKDFGGRDSVELFGAAYTYPENSFTTNYLTVTAVDENGYTVDKQVKIDVNLNPKPSWTGTGTGTGEIVSMCDYYERNALYFTDDRTIANMAKSDVYACSGTVGTIGVGAAYMVINATSLIVPSWWYNAVYPGFGDVYSLPPHEVLSLPHFLSARVTVGSVTNDYSIPLFDSAGSHVVSVVANVGQSNTLVAERDGYAVSIRPKDVGSFGSMTSLSVNGRPELCTNTSGLVCTVDLPGEADVMATNMWSGVARATVIAPSPEEMRPTAGKVQAALTGPGVFMMVLMGVGGAVVAARLFRKWISWTGDVFFN